MAINIKNYTSGIQVITSLGRIEEYLVDAGASQVMKDYNSDKICTGIKFMFFVDGIPIQFKITASTEECYKALLDQYKKPTAQTYQNCREQAGRTAWKIISDWIEIQVTMIKLNQAKPMQLFLPYAYNSGTDETFYEHVQKGNYKLLGEAKS